MARRKKETDEWDLTDTPKSSSELSSSSSLPSPSAALGTCLTCSYSKALFEDFTMECTLKLPPQYASSRRPVVMVSHSCSLHKPK